VRPKTRFLKRLVLVPEGLVCYPVRDARHPEALAVAEPWEHFKHEEEGQGPQQDRHLRGR